jgi:biotin transport system substrate-specific component
MQNISSVLNPRNLSVRYFEWFYELSIATKVFLSVCFAALTALSAIIRVQLPFTPVPITGQVMVVLLTGVVLGAGYGSLSQLIYVLLGTIGMPWFTAGQGGLFALLGPTGGYLIGFIPAAFIVGFLTHHFSKFRSFLVQFVIMILAISVIHLFGIIHFSLLLRTNLTTTLKMASLPFIIPDLIKALIVAYFSSYFLPRNYNC